MRRWPLVLIVACVALVGVSLARPEAFRRVEMSSESDGRHQDDYKAFGFLPYSKQRQDLALRVTDDAFRALRAAGVKEGPEAHRSSAFRPVVRAFYPDGRTVYTIQFELTRPHARAVAESYARQLVKPAVGHGPLSEGVAGMCPDGRTRLEFSADGGAPAQLRFWKVVGTPSKP